MPRFERESKPHLLNLNQAFIFSNRQSRFSTGSELLWVVTWPLISAALASFFVGCHKSPYELAPVEGTVTVDGQPLTHAKVMFAPLAKGDDAHSGKAAMGVLNAEGSFILGTYGESDGAVVGEHSVTIINSEPTASAAVGNGGSVKAIPKFARARASGTFEVVAGQLNRFDIKLTRQDLSRFSTVK